MSKSAFVLIILLAGCAPSTGPDRLICFAGDKAILDITVLKGVNTCYYDMGHRALCFQSVSGESVIINPAFACVVMHNPAPNATAQPTTTPEATPPPKSRAPGEGG